MKDKIKKFLLCWLIVVIAILFLALAIVGVIVLYHGLKSLNLIQIIVGIVILSFCMSVMLFADTYF